MCVFGLCGIGYTHLGKIINIKKTVRFTTCTRSYDSRKCESTQNRESRKGKSEHRRVKLTSTSDPSEHSQVRRDIRGTL